jgi:hypothetical protein
MMPFDLVPLTGYGKERPACAKMYPMLPTLSEQARSEVIEKAVAHFEARWHRKVDKCYLWQGNLYIEFDESWEKEIERSKSNG